MLDCDDIEYMYEMEYKPELQLEYYFSSRPSPTNSARPRVVPPITTKSSSQICEDLQYIRDKSNGNALLFVNDHFALDDELEDVDEYLQMLLETNIEIRHPQKKSYKNDLFGFQRSDEYLQTDKDFHKLQSSAVQSRDMDWVEYLNNIGGADNIKSNNDFRSSPELKQLVRRGIPIAYRAAIWSRISLSSSYKTFYPTDYYQTLLLKENELPRRTGDEIEKDLDRTFPRHEYFSSSSLGEDSLRRVLRAFALHKADIGYCQSLNFLAAFMLLLMTEEDSFWLLVTLVDTILPQDYYTNSMIGSNVDHYVLCELIKTSLPRMHKFLTENSLEFPLITLQWFMCLFINTFRPEVTLRIWDILFNEGSKVLFRIGIALLKMHEKELLKVKDGGDLLVVLNGIGKNIVDADALIAFAYKSYNPAKPKTPIFGSVKSRPSPSPSNAELRGLGMAHLGPMAAPSERSSPVPSESHSPTFESIPATDEVLRNEPEEIQDSAQSQGLFSNFSSIFRLPQLNLSSDAYRSFKRLDIESLRFQVRPQVVKAYRATVLARAEWMEKQNVEEESLAKKPP